MLKKTLLFVFLNRFIHAPLNAVVSLFAGNAAKTFTSLAVQADALCGDQFETKTTGHRFGLSLLLFFALMTGGVSTAMAGLFCSGAPFNGVVDGNLIGVAAPAGYGGTIADPFPTQITIDTDCTFQNFPASNPLTATLNFQTNDPSVYLITFNNVIFTGNMACANIDHRIWFVNGSDYGSKKNCQDLFIPVEAIDKKNPAGTTSVGIGEPFTYTLTIPVLYDPVTGTILNNLGSANDLHSIVITDDLNATGADLTVVGTPAVTWLGSGTPVVHTFDPSSNDPVFSNPGTAGSLKFVIDPGVIIPAGDQILIEVTVVADNTNAVGTQFVNTAKWEFGRLIEIDGVPTPFDPLPGENGVTQPLTIAAPDLVVSKTASISAINALDTATFAIDVQNNGASDAWGATIRDLLPDVGAPGADTGMCDFDPTATVTAEIFAADGVTSVSIGALNPGVDYTVSYTAAPGCELSLTMLTARAVIGPTERLIITYDSILDIAGTDVGDDGTVLTNIAGAEQWFSADPAGANPFATFTRTITDGTPGVPDFQDSLDTTATLSGYVFQKTVLNVNTGESGNNAITAAPGDTLRYKLRLFNFTEVIDDLIVTDTFNTTDFDLNSFVLLTSPLPAGVAVSYDSGTGVLTIDGGGGPLDLDPLVNPDLVIEFQIKLEAGLANGIVVPNQAHANATGLPVFAADSDDPFDNGVYDPDLGGLPDTTDVTIQTPGALSKVNPAQTTVTIGDQFTYTVLVPAVPESVPLYDVRILDDLTASGADLGFVSAAVLSGGSWVLSNTGTSSNVVIEDTGAGIDIPAGVQAEIAITVELLNTATNQNTLLAFNNTATFTYNRTNGNDVTETIGAGATTADMTVVEPNITTVTKVANNTTPTAGEIVTYTLELTASNGAVFSDVFDITLIDNMDLGLEYVGNPTVSLGAGVGAGNVIGDPDITGDGITIPQTLEWGPGSTVASDIDIQAGDIVTITYDVRVLNTVLAGATLNNTVVAQWHSLDGAPNFERTGVDGIGGLNDYTTAPVIEILTVPSINATISKVHTTDTYGAADTDVRLGDTVDYTLAITIPEGTLVNAQIVDTLPQGLEFVDIVSINNVLNPGPYTAVAPFSHAVITVAGSVVLAGDPLTGPSTVTWNLSNVTNLPVNDASNDFIIVYRARVVDGSALFVTPAPTGVPTNTNIPLNNTVDINYDTALGKVTNSDIDTIINALQPSLTVTKNVSAAGGGTVVVADELITYTVDIENTGTAPAYDVVLQDTIPVGLRNGVATVTIVSSDLVSGAGYAPLVPVYDAITGVASWNFDSGVADAYTIPAGETLRVVYTVQADPAIGPGLTMTNAATATLYYSFDDEAAPVNSVVADRQQYGPSNTATTTLTTSPGAPLKANPVDPTATIGQEFSYTITIPEVAQPTPLYDVQVLDNLAVIGADVTLVSLANLSGGAWVPFNSGTPTSLVIEDTTNGIDIPANQTITIGVTVRLDNTLNNNAADTFSNTASYTYNAIDGNNGSQLPGGSSITPLMTVVEPDLTMTKVVTNATVGKAATDPITGGDILQYVVTITNAAGAAMAFDVNVVDTLPAELAYYAAFVPTATINTAAVGGFVSTPAGTPGGPLIWGSGNGDSSLDVPAGGVLVITYQTRVQVSTAATFNNSILIDWTSLDGVSAFERDGTGCPAVVVPDDYCFGPVQVVSNIIDNNSLSKVVTADSYADAFSTANDGIVRIGDTVTYQLTLNLGEGTTNSVTVSDLLPAGMVYDSLNSITPVSGGTFNYTVASQPAAGVTGTLVWDLGNVINTPSNDGTPTDALVIEYTTRVIANHTSTIGQQPSTVLDNTATLAYKDGAGATVIDPIRLESQASITVWQPIMSAVSKTGNTLTNTAVSALNVDVANDLVAFQLQSCNSTGLSGQAPAYSVLLTDDLGTDLTAELDENSITGLTVVINGAPAVAGTDYNYTPPAARGGTLQFKLLTPVNPGQCVTINYDIGFYTDFGPGQIWNNSVTVNEYWSLPASSGQLYTPVDSAQFHMTNQVGNEPLTKDVASPASGEITIGEDAVYTITIPGNPVNAVLNNVVVTDTLDAALTYISATAVDTGDALVVLVDTTVAQDVELTIASIPAGEQVIITLQTRVANNASANAGDTFANTAEYDYTGKPPAETTGGTSGVLTIVEPAVAIAKAVNPLAAPNAGDVLTYTLTFTASGGDVAPVDFFSNAYDLRIDDSLGLGLAYVPGTSTAGGAGNAITDPVVTGDGITTPQSLLWRVEDATADIDIVEGSVVTVTYDVVVLDSVLAGQELTNTASSQWTGTDEIIGDPVNVDERNGSTTPVVNDYFNGPVTTTLTTLDNTAITKNRITDTFDGTNNVRIGDQVDYELRIHLDEGNHSSLVITDALPQGLQFEQVVSINGDNTAPFASVAPFTHTDIAAPGITGNAATGPTTVTWNIGDVVNVGDNNAANDDFVIIYRARPLNNDVFTQQNTTDLINNATLDYVIATGPAQQIDGETITLLQPDLSAMTKTSVPASGSVVSAGQSIDFTVQVSNTGTAAAYDTVIQDVLSVGLRQIVPVATSIYLQSNPGNLLPVLQPVYDANTGIAVWNLDSGGENTYTILAGDALVIEYTAQTDNDLGPGQNLSNLVAIDRYYSLDDEEADTDVNHRQEYTPNITATTTFTTPLPTALSKVAIDPVALDPLNPITEVAIGDTFVYRITVPATPQTTALNDVRILDNLNTSAASLTFVSVSKFSGSLPWTPANTGDFKNLVIEDTVNGIDIPAGEVAVIDITVVVDDANPPNVGGLVFNNTADYSYEVAQLPGQPGISNNVEIIEPVLQVTKTGPAIMQVGLPSVFTIDVVNTGSSTAWDITVEDALPNPTPGGMCDTAPANITVSMIDINGTTVLTDTVHYDVTFVSDPNAPDCLLTLTMKSQNAADPDAAVDPGETLRITYEALLDIDNIGGANLTNVAAATQWFSGDTNGAGATGEIRTYIGTRTDGTVGTIDEQDAHTVAVEIPTLVFTKTAVNVTSSGPGNAAAPGDILRYTLHVANISSVIVSNFSLIDELDALNALPMFVPGSLQVDVASLPAGAIDASDPNGGANGTGLINITNLSLAGQGDPGNGDVVDLIFDVQLAPAIDSGTVVLNQAVLDTFGVELDISDDPAILVSDDDPTETLISSAPAFQVEKVSDDITGDPAVLEQGDTLRYTITVKNTGTENTVNTLLTDQIPANTTYVAGSTTLNGVVVTDPSTGVSALETGVSINTPIDATAGFMPADIGPAANNVATISFDVVINASVIDGTVISNQGFVTGEGAGSGVFPQQPSDDPGTALVDDPTLDVVGSSPSLRVIKTVVLQGDVNNNGLINPNDTLRYTITTTNIGTVAATNVVLLDELDALNTPAAFVPGSLNIISATAGADTSNTDVNGGVNGSGLLDVRIPGLDTAAGSDTMEVIFDVVVNNAVNPGDIISNQGFVSSNEIPTKPSDADGIDANGDQPTEVVVGNVQQLSITKQVLVVGGGGAVAGGELEYVIRVTNIGNVDATNVVITDNLNTVEMNYINDSGLLDGLPTGLINPNITTNVGDLPIAGVAELRFRVRLSATLAIGQTVTNTAGVSWDTNLPPFTDAASVDIDIGGIPGSANLNGQLWHDSNFDNVADSNETLLQGWTVALYRNSRLLASTVSDSSGVYQFSGVVANITTGLPGGDPYEIRFTAPGAVATTATLGDGSSAFTNGPQNIRDILATSGGSVQSLNMPRQPNGIVYDSVIRVPVAGTQLTMVNQTRSNQIVPGSCFDDSAQQGQVTLADGYYKFDLNFSNSGCVVGDEYVIQIQPPANGYVGTTSAIIPPVVPVSGAALDVPNCPGDQVPATTQHCETSISSVPPAPSVAPGTVGTEYYLKFLFDNADFTDQVFNNHIPVDPELAQAVSISKVAGLVNVTRSQLVPYTITVSNTLPVPLYGVNIVDHFPAGFKYVSNSSRVNGFEVEPVILGNVLTWQSQTVPVNGEVQVKLLLIVGSGVGEGEYVNTAQAINSANNEPFSGIASATVRVIPDPSFDCTDIIGKVFDDKNNNAYQDEGEKGLPGVQLATARGLRITTDQHGRFHITCAVVPNEVRGSNFIIKLDDRTLPSGYRITTENPRVQRATRGKMLKFNFGAVIHRVVRLDLADGVFEKGSTELRPQWRSRIDMLITELEKDASILRLSYLGENETESEVENRLDAVEELISERWQHIDCCYKLTIEKEVFWRKGKPSDRRGFE